MTITDNRQTEQSEVLGMTSRRRLKLAALILAIPPTIISLMLITNRPMLVISTLGIIGTTLAIATLLHVHYHS